jgi:hypothetical protein
VAARKKKTAAKKGAHKPGFDFIVKRLEKDPQAVYADIRAAAEKAGHTVYPIMFGRAKASLGLVKSKPRGSKKTRAAAFPQTARRGPGRPRKAAGPASLEEVVRHLRDQERDVRAMRAALERVRGVVDEVLG